MKLKRERHDWPSEWRKPVEQSSIPVGEAPTEKLHAAAAAGEAKKSGRQPSPDASEEKRAAAGFSQEDIRTRRIIGRGTERQGLYYVDEMAHQGSAAMLAHGSATREAWLWHRRYGHPSHGYFKLLFPKFSHFKNFDCESCVLAKSHRQSFKSSETRVKSLFSLVHADV
ncbi:uncharacterized protein LOC125209817 [Salvia hispanica]|uniref:uncharacterized protein LOC125209817 n=1 Tax=Salvia hispanica TaxID=49212 RepID=UPI00200947A3|nr:uncharacterized protein LOC125209817 [Salvia hispanica]